MCAWVPIILHWMGLIACSAFKWRMQILKPNTKNKWFTRRFFGMTLGVFFFSSQAISLFVFGRRRRRRQRRCWRRRYEKAHPTNLMIYSSIACVREPVVASIHQRHQRRTHTNIFNRTNYILKTFHIKLHSKRHSFTTTNQTHKSTT